MTPKVEKPVSKLPVALSVFQGFEFKQEESNAKRAAHALHWLSKRHPGACVAWNILFRVISLWARTPALNSQEATKLRRSTRDIKRWLLEIYGDNLVVEPGFGVRASYDERDKLLHALPPAIKRFNSSRASLGQVQKNIDASKIARTAETANLLDAHKDSKNVLSYAGRYPSLTAAVVPPPKPDDKK